MASNARRLAEFVTGAPEHWDPTGGLERMLLDQKGLAYTGLSLDEHGDRARRSPQWRSGISR